MAKEQVSSILRALEILECFMDNETEWTLKRLVEQLDLPTTTVHDLPCKCKRCGHITKLNIEAPEPESKETSA